MNQVGAIARAAGCAIAIAWLGASCDGREQAREASRELHPLGSEGRGRAADVEARITEPTRAPDVVAPTPVVGSGVGAPAAADGARRLLGEGPDEDSVLRALALATPRRFGSVGTTAVVLKMDLGATIDGAFKPRTHLHPQGWLAEIAAFRVARCLGLDDVPAAVTRTMRREQLRERLDPEDAAKLPLIESRILWDGDSVRGAAIQWIRGLTPLGLERDERVAQWSGWLSQAGAPAPAEQVELARDISNTLVFDYVIGNFDRWSGSNLGGTPDGRRLYIRDHNLAFVSPLPHEQGERLWRRLGRAQRFSLSLVRALRELDAARLREELERDPSLHDRPRLVGNWVRDVLGRRDAVLSHVATLIDEHGAARVLVFR